MEKKYDVVAVNLETNTVRLMAFAKSGPNANGIVNLAVMRRGVDEEFFAVTPAGFYADGDTWKGPHDVPTESVDERRGSIVRVGNMWFPDGPRGLQE